MVNIVMTTLPLAALLFVYPSHLLGVAIVVRREENSREEQRRERSSHRQETGERDSPKRAHSNVFVHRSHRSLLPPPPTLRSTPRHAVAGLQPRNSGTHPNPPPFPSPALRFADIFALLAPSLTHTHPFARVASLRFASLRFASPPP
jgi:hypothetical protein